MFNELISMLTSTLIIHQQWLNLVEIHLMPSIIVLSLVTVMSVELLWVDSVKSKTRMIQSYLTNIATFVFNSTLLSVLSISSILVLAENYQIKGLFNDYNQLVEVFLTFILFDLTLYIWHHANHQFDFLWKFHKVHHCDQSMNSTTAFRVHFIEVILSTLVKAIFIIMTGVEISVVVICESISTLFIIFHHLNLPIWGEKWLKWIIIVPILHRNHHSPVRKEHDSNYGNVFSIWDRVFKTLNEAEPNETGLINVKSLNFYQLLTFGLLPQASYSKVNTLKPENFNSMVAEAAYYIAEKRGFMTGLDQLDWFQAEQQISEYIKMKNSRHARFDFLHLINPFGHRAKTA